MTVVVVGCRAAGLDAGLVRLLDGGGAWNTLRAGPARWEEVGERLRRLAGGVSSYAQLRTTYAQLRTGILIQG
jgi:hypothetical protein